MSKGSAIELESRLDMVRDDVLEFRAQMAEFRTDLTQMSMELTEIKDDLDSLKTKVDVLASNHTLLVGELHERTKITIHLRYTEMDGAGTDWTGFDQPPIVVQDGATASDPMQ
ncbi:hypothetical protein [Brevibacillus dissolubilis]|uniref:hypothetical protein n=1 Tax=Brevibacillus dissolubilis TaxID=1844116 RepID=UPI001115F947|nr:hypothetical protein [Brevibacillus dissolubilis]